MLFTMLLQTNILNLFFDEVHSQARTQTLEKGGANWRVFTKGGMNVKNILILRLKLGV